MKKTSEKEIQRIKTAILVLADHLDGLAWRVSTEEERNAGVEISEAIRKLLGVSKNESKERRL